MVPCLFIHSFLAGKFLAGISLCFALRAPPVGKRYFGKGAGATGRGKASYLSVPSPVRPLTQMYMRVRILPCEPERKRKVEQRQLMLT